MILFWILINVFIFAISAHVILQNAVAIIRRCFISYDGSTQDVIIIFCFILHLSASVFIKKSVAIWIILVLFFGREFYELISIFQPWFCLLLEKIKRHSSGHVQAASENSENKAFFDITLEKFKCYENYRVSLKTCTVTPHLFKAGLDAF